MTENEYYTFNKVRVVMVNTTEAGNIGASARALKNMCLSRLYLVNPSNYPSATATARASGADDILANAKVCKSLTDALTGCNLIIGASARKRSVKWQQLSLMQSCELIENTITNDNEAEVAVVFGTENSGLSNNELDMCQVLMTIAGNKDYFSLNVSQAVQIFSYQLYNQLIDTKYTPLKQDDGDKLAKFEDIEYFYRHLEQILIRINYLNGKKPIDLLMRRLRVIFSKALLKKDELAILRGILNAIEKYKP